MFEKILHKDNLGSLEIDMKRFGQTVSEQTLDHFGNISIIGKIAEVSGPAEHLGDIEKNRLIEILHHSAMRRTDLFSPECCQFDKSSAVGVVILKTLPGLQVGIEQRRLKHSAQ